MNEWGVDVSRWQGNFNFEKAKAEGIKFAILKAGGGDAGLYKDGKFERNYTECKNLNIPCGAYFFGCAMNVATAEREADYFVSLLKGKSIPMIVWYDVEGKMLNAANLASIVSAFINRVQAQGFPCGVYTNEWVFTGKLKGITINYKWVARWTKNPPSIKYNIWQFGGETNLLRSNRVAGVVCDQNYYVGGLVNIEPKPLPPIPEPEPKPTPSPKKSNEEIAKEVLAGKWGNGADRKKRLTDAGYSYSAVQNIVNKLVKEQKSKPAEPTKPIDNPIYYTVKSGDTLGKIAKKYGTTVEKLKSLNPQIKNVDLIYPKQKIRIR